jgi:hypothetical protein
VPALLVVLVGALGVGAWPWPSATSASGPGPASGPGGSTLTAVSITHDADGPATTYAYAASGPTVAVTAPAGEGGNERDAFWFTTATAPTTATGARNEESCSTWDASPGLTQQGEMLHLTRGTRGAGGAVRGLAVVDNIWLGHKWLFNIYAITGDARDPIRFVKRGFDLSAVVGGKSGPYVPLPWHECARTLDGQIQFVVWTGSNPRPAYGTPGASCSVAIPPGYDGPGTAGWWVGHVGAGATARFSALATARLGRAPPSGGRHCPSGY